ncbi:DNA-directed RNA polymerases I and III subunit RPAC1 [Ooceraea biroi]|uniref:DNA-directed RNA polymerases I and III subunit RPAC1 n=1 Tax=Ooceraea biroi TaxID=2015173 RepID=UPI000F07B2EE|nr:DNA-directed RNA polymerases I and III subunit RPAC1 [Ooceraea biroi]XP_011339498.2 DNA-directed RNA polymerases I and III subunit RPAC1 [Ooceraea biroi]XP_011339500.2 DNA-directed RNA polymerases I and III subunit RPAC1 [Ooceraea biroi]XP_011339501.2 DNA-directed RNA polymerases I and III subunit RPAC1 [Ooceraea biroi]XP_011339502.2 DNA-directed RNA polymerases I and III subunit RPAC1 [Ooceraea biroi]XP_011339503.2 DNA-directed RNA polymerases I and III subunit RPAC1 [Ooceraea biroi]
MPNPARDKKQDPRWCMKEHENVREYTYYPEKSTALEKIKKKLKIEVVREQDRELEFDLIGCDTSLVNAFRRILISEVPSMAIEQVYIVNNTSILQDEVFAHRMGLIPLRADARLFEFPPQNKRPNGEIGDQDTLRYELKVTCTKNPQAPKLSTLPDDLYRNSKIYSKDIKWVPIGRQADMFPRGTEQFGMVDEDILIAKLRPGHEIHAYMHAVKGVGKDHAKFSPVALATYRLMPGIELLKPIRNADADLLQKCFSPGVIEVVEQQTSSGEKNREARVANARYDNCSRNVFYHEQLKNCVELTRIRDHFIFTVETVGALPSSVLFIEAVKVLKNKCRTFLAEMDGVNK